MWPQTLQMSKDECRMTLRRLELESYATVIGALRAQGGLTARKLNLLEELRTIFHISQDRHRAEARRVANDEQLSTIAENVSGPNTWQEWSREGRRAFPLLPRVAPQTALGFIANKLAAEAASENAKLPYPSETGIAAAQEQAEANVETEAARQHGIAERYRNYVVMEDPFKMPDIPSGPRKYQKRSAADNNYVANKKRFLQNDNHYVIPSKNSTLQQQSPHGKQSFHVTGSPNTSPTGGGGGSANKKSAQNSYISSKLQQQRFFHYQQQKAKKLAKSPKKREMAAGLTLEGKPKSKAGRKPKKLKELEEQQRRLQQQHQIEHQQMEMEIQAQQLLDVVESEHLRQQSPNMSMEIQYPLQQHQQHLHYQPVSHIDNYSEMKDTVHQVASIMTSMPQIAASKKEAMRHQNKLQLPNAANRLIATAGNAHQQQITIVQPELSPVLSSPGAPVMLATGANKTTTPVQKYIVEERQPQSQPCQNAVVATHPLPVGAVLQAATTPLASNAQFMTVPQYSATANKLRGVNTTILPQGTKVPPTKKVASSILSLSSGSVASPNAASSVTIFDHNSSGNNNSNSTNQMFSLIDSTNVTGSPTNLPATLIQSQQPTHAPPAIIQLQHNNDGGQQQQLNTSANPTIVSSTHSKVLTTKLLPIILSNATANSVCNVNASLGATVSSQCGSITKVVEPLNSAASNAIGTTIVKNLTPSMLTASGLNVGGSASNLNSSNILSGTGTVISTLNTGSASGSGILNTGGTTTTILRKQPNILKSSNRLPSSNKPQIISNIRLTPAFTTTPTSTTLTLSNQLHQPGHAQLHEQVNYQGTTTRQILPTAPLRANVKICSSPNGKVFLQPTNPDGSTRGSITKLQGTGNIQHRILQSASGNILTKAGTTLSTSSVPGTSQQRFQIQKVQIIPATGQSQAGRIPGTVTISSNNSFNTSGSKNNMTIISAAGPRTAGTPITISKHAITTVGNARSIIAKPNVVLINTHKTASGAQLLRPTARFSGTGKINVMTSLSNPQLTTVNTISKIAQNTTFVTANQPENVSLALDTNQIIAKDNTQWITQDTPVDIIVDDDIGGENIASIINAEGSGSDGNSDVRKSVGSSASTSSAITVLESNLIDNKLVGSSNTSLKQLPSIVPDATDWEMELDQAKQQRSSSSNSNDPNADERKFSEDQMHTSSNVETEETIVIDDSYEDVIIEEQYEDNTIIDGPSVVEARESGDGGGGDDERSDEVNSQGDDIGIEVADSVRQDEILESSTVDNSSKFAQAKGAEKLNIVTECETSTAMTENQSVMNTTESQDSTQNSENNPQGFFSYHTTVNFDEINEPDDNLNVPDKSQFTNTINESTTTTTTMNNFDDVAKENKEESADDDVEFSSSKTDMLRTEQNSEENPASDTDLKEITIVE